jgi:hypothetical protein
LIVVIGMRKEVWPGGGWGFGNYEESKRWLDMNEEVAYRKMLSCTNKMMVKNMGKFLFRV